MAVLLVGLAAAAAVAAAAGLLDGRPPGIEVSPGAPSSASIADVAGFEPFAYEDGDPDDFLERGRDGYSHPLYAFSPGGAAASAARTARFRSRIEDAAERHEIEPETLEALVMLESAGRPDVAAGDDPDSAVGLGQILPGTASGVLGMSVDLEASKRLTRAIARERERARRAPSPRARRAALRRAAGFARRRREVDERYDPTEALDGAARYLGIAQPRFGREDLAVASYHMGLANLKDVIDAYIAPAPPESTTRATVDEHELSYTRLLFDSSPLENRRAHRLLAGFDDDSRSYLFRVEAAREIMELHRDDPDELARRERLHAQWPSGELVRRPPEESEPFANPAALRDAYEGGDLISLPDDPKRLGYTLDPGLGRFAARSEASHPSLYRGLRPEAVATLLFITKEVRRVAGRANLRVTDAVRDPAAPAGAGEPPRAFSPHTTGYAFDIAREYGSPRVGRAFAHVLERLRALRVIDYVYERDEIHVGAGPEAERLLPVQEALVSRGGVGGGSANCAAPGDPVSPSVRIGAGRARLERTVGRVAPSDLLKAPSKPGETDMETTPDRVPEPDRDRVDAEADAAAAEAAQIGGRAADDDLDPGDRPLVEAGGGEAEGFELAESDLIENAEHGEGGHERGVPEPESDRSGGVYGDADNDDRTDEITPLDGLEGGATEDPAGR